MNYQAPSSIAEVCRLLADSDGHVRILAGGTDLIPQMQFRRLQADLIVDIKKIPETRRIESMGGGFTIGAAVTGAELGEHEEIGRAWPGVVEALGLVGSTQIQGRATLGGNLCNASPAADSVPALIAAAATCRIAGPQGEREARVEDVVVSPGRTSLQKGEFIVSFTLPPRPARSADAYLRLIPRTEMDIAVVGAAVSLSRDEAGRCRHARVALGAVAPSAILVAAAGRILEGSSLDSSTMERFSAAVRQACRPIADKRGTAEYRIEVAGVLAARSAALAWQRVQTGLQTVEAGA